MNDEYVDHILDKMLDTEWFLDGWLLSFAYRFSLPINKEALRKMPVEKKRELVDELAAALPDPEEE